jgi:hypothetical protein
MKSTDYIDTKLKDLNENEERSPFLKRVDEVLGNNSYDFGYNNIKNNEPEKIIDPVTNKPDLSQEEKELINVIVKSFDGYNYETKKEDDTVNIIFKQNIGGDLVKKWATAFPNNEYKGIKLNIDVQTS